jgi:hypothetical protein
MVIVVAGSTLQVYGNGSGSNKNGEELFIVVGQEVLILVSAGLLSSAGPPNDCVCMQGSKGKAAVARQWENPHEEYTSLYVSVFITPSRGSSELD